VENVLYQHPKVAEAAVTGAPDPVYGEIVMAALVLKKNESLTPEEVQEFCKRFLADYKVPKRVKFLDALPRNSAGKVLKKEL
jgi:acyl-CoA synthetase (AMP-forming)/AMP-acid ligase II